VATTSRTTPKSKAPKAHFDIAAVEREVNDGETVEPFTVRLTTGTVIELKNPKLLGWQLASSLTPEQPLFAMRAIVPEEVWDEFVQEDFSVGTMQLLIKAWREHHGQLDLGE
jgi:hypothetical protein